MYMQAKYVQYISYVALYPKWLRDILGTAGNGEMAAEVGNSNIENEKFSPWTNLIKTCSGEFIDNGVVLVLP